MLIVLAIAFSGLSYSVDDQSLKDAFTSFGDVVEGEYFLFYFDNLALHFKQGNVLAVL